MNSNTQVFFDEPATLRTFLRSPSSINLGKEFPTLPAHILNDGSELSKSSVKHMLPKHPFGTDAVIQVFHENHITNITKGMGLLEVEVFPRVVNLMVKSGNFKALFFVVFRPLTFSLQSALQHFQPTLQTFKELWRFYKNTVTCCQEFLHPNINSHGMTVGCWVGNVDITLQRNRCVPFIGFPQDSDLFDHKPCRDRSMQVDGNRPNLGQFNVQIRHRILFKLRKQQRLKLPILLESGEAEPSLLKIFPPSMQLLNSLLENLRRNLTQLGKFFLSFRQVVKLLNFAWELQLRRNDVLFLQRASVNRTLTTVTPIFYLSECIVKCASTDFHPLNELLLLSGVWIDSVVVCKCQHSSIIECLLVSSVALNVNLRKIESHKINLGESMYPRAKSEIMVWVL